MEIMSISAQIEKMSALALVVVALAWIGFLVGIVACARSDRACERYGVLVGILGLILCIQSFTDYPAIGYWVSLYPGPVAMGLVSLIVLAVVLARRDTPWEERLGRRVLYALFIAVFFVKLVGVVAGPFLLKTKTGQHVQRILATEANRAVEPLVKRAELLEEQAKKRSLTAEELAELKMLPRREREAQKRYVPTILSGLPDKIKAVWDGWFSEEDLSCHTLDDRIGALEWGERALAKCPLASGETMCYHFPRRSDRFYAERSSYDKEVRNKNVAEALRGDVVKERRDWIPTSLAEEGKRFTTVCFTGAQRRGELRTIEIIVTRMI